MKQPWTDVPWNSSVIARLAATSKSMMQVRGKMLGRKRFTIWKNLLYVCVDLLGRRAYTQGNTCPPRRVTACIVYSWKNSDGAILKVPSNIHVSLCANSSSIVSDAKTINRSSKSAWSISEVYWQQIHLQITYNIHTSDNTDRASRACLAPAQTGGRGHGRRRPSRGPPPARVSLPSRRTWFQPTEAGCDNSGIGR